MALDDMYEIKHNMTVLGENVLNVYHALRSNVGEDAQEVADSFANSVFPIVQDFQSDEITNVDLVCQSLGDPEDFHTQSLTSATGDRTVTDLATFNSGEVRFPRQRTDMRNGYKRYVGLGEEDVANQQVLAPAIALLQDIGDALVANWLASSDSHHVANYVIIKRICTITPDPGDPCPSYRLPESDEELVFYQPIEAIAFETVRSQVSRRTPA